MIYALLSNKDENTYERFFRVIKQLCPAQPQCTLIDFETTAANVILTVFQTPGNDLSIEGCFFSCKSKHLQTHAHREGLKANYENEVAFALLVRCLAAR